MGVPAFVKTPKGYRPTEDGKRIIAHAERMANESDTLARYLDGTEAGISDPVKISLNSSFLNYVVAHSVKVLMESHPDIALSFMTDDRLADLGKREADIVLRMQQEPQPSLFGRRLCEARSAIYAQKELASDLRLLRKPLPVVGWAGEDRVQTVFEELGFPDIRVVARASDITAQVAIARIAGVAVELPCYVGDQEPDFVRLSPRSSRLINDVWILTHESLKHSKKIRAAIEAISTVVLANRNLIEGTAGFEETIARGTK